MKIEPLSFDLINITCGKLSAETHSEHLKLYNGYIKNANLILEKISTYTTQQEQYTYEIGELFRRFSFEYNGIKNHEFYFEQLTNGKQTLDIESHLYRKISTQWGSWDNWVDQFTLLAKTRGIGWAVLYHDRERDLLLNVWIDEQHLGHLNNCSFIYGIDMWEHSYVSDYLPSGKSDYIADYIHNTDWSTVSHRYSAS